MSTLIDSKRLHSTRVAYALVREAHARLKACGAVDAAARLASTFDSLRGAVRHAESLNYLGDEDHARRRRRRRPKHTAAEIARRHAPQPDRREATAREMRQAGPYR